MTSARRLHYSYDEYLELLGRSDFKLEYCDGVIYAMAGGTIAHAALCAACVGILRQNVGEGCMVFTSDLKVRVEASDLSTFPDVSVVCGEVRSAKLDPHAVTNPIVLVEVTSRSTEDYDRGDKLSHYKQLPSLRAVLFVSHRMKRITVIERSNENAAWRERDYRAGERVRLSEPALEFAVDEAYEGISLDRE